ncbi:putative helicase MOV-10 [Watersipora subatra]|uniref:putative helicase MOV-10 n=1 Tax=Watersipora subatra TaxID=2589382 RepID=UPI00355AD523
MKVDIGHYTLEEVSMRLDSRTGLFRLTVPGLAENRPSVLRGDRVFVSPLPICGQKYEGYVHNVTLTELFLGFNKRLSKMYIANMRFRVEFTINRLSLKLEHRAVSWAGAHSDLGLEKVLFPAAQDRIPPFLPLLQTDLRCYERKVENNNEQLKAVLHIVCGTSRPSPYLIYGPPGTGKSFTLVEAIKQVFNRFKESHILVCAPQNAAADLLAGRLLDHIPKDAILRLNALSRAYGDIERKVQEVSNYKSVSGVASRAVRHGLSGKSKQGDMQVEYPNKDVLKKKRVIVSTLVTSGRLVSADLSSHFTHIFIDEAGHATEPETVIPLAGLLDTQMANGGQVVLAGDPQQLGPIIRSNIASDRGLGQSLLERYMSMELYSRGLSGEFNPDYVTKLVRSFRSHPDILEVPNTCFYDNELIAHADKMQRERFCNWEGLPRKGFPLIFHGVNGEEEQEGNSPSWFNRFEVMQLILYLEKLFECKSPKIKPEHIGIITPYHKQAIKIQQALKALEVSHKGHMKNFAQIKVGSVEKFQGDEREVIIISTVRSQDVYLTHDKKFNLGFVRNPKRFNVAVTRAKAMLIIIGNPAVLSKDASWLSLLTFIEEGGGYVGCPLTEEDIEEDEDDLNSLQEKFELMKIKADEVSEGLLVGDQEWHRKE